MIQTLVAFVVLAASISAFAQIKPDPHLAQVIQMLEVFNRPASCAVSLDGKHLFVANTAATTNGMPLGKGVISKLEIQADGTLKMLNLKFVEGLNAPMGMAAAPKATKKFKAGFLYVATGSIDACDDKGNRVTDIKVCNPGITIIDPGNGAIAGFIPMATDTAAAKNLGNPVLQASGVCFDSDGNLFFADAGQMGDELKPQVHGRPGIKRVRLEQIDSYAQDKQVGQLSFVAVRFIPNGVYYHAGADQLFWSCHGSGAARGSVWRMERKNFPVQGVGENVFGGEAPLAGLCITPNDTVIASQQEGTLKYINKTKFDTVPFKEQDLVFASPADIKLHVLPNKNTILYIPEKEPSAEKQWNQRLRVVLLSQSM